jgi:choline/glycine/proline betaine transport protein
MPSKVEVGRFGIFPRVSRPVFGASAIIILGFIVFGALFTETASAVFSGAQAAITEYFGWLFILTTNAALLVCIYLALGRYGDIRLGQQEEAPRYGLISWAAMLFSAGMGIGLVYWSVAEPMFHFSSPPIGQPETQEAATQAMVLAFLHWGLHGWAIYAIVALPLAYFAFRRGLPLSIRSAFYPLLGDRIYGPLGHVVDVFAVFGTIFGVVTSLGLGAMQFSSGLELLTGLPNTVWVQLGVIAGITALAVVSVVLGLDRGIKRLSRWNIWLSLVLLGFVFAFGPTLFLVDSLVENVGNYIARLPTLALWNEAYESTNWQGDWTIF